MSPILLGLLGFGLLHGANREVHRFERLAAQEISTKISGDARDVRVLAVVGPEVVSGELAEVDLSATRFEAEGLPLFTEPERSKAGRVQDLRIDLSDFALRGLHVYRLRARIPDCRFDLPLAARHHTFRLSRSGLGEGEVVVGARDLGAFIVHKFHEVKSALVRIENDKITVEGHGEFLLLSTDFTIVARLVPDGGARLVLRDARIQFDGQPAGEAAEKVLLDTLNPVVDLDRDLGLHGAMHVEQVVLRDGLVRAFGTIKIPDRPAGPP